MFEIAVVMTDREHGMAALAKGGQQVAIEHPPELRVLVGGPFVEQQDVAGLRKREHERDTLALPLGEAGIANPRAVEIELVGQAEPCAPVVDERLACRCPVDAEQPVEQMKIGEHGREQASIGGAIARPHRHIVDTDLAGDRAVQAGQQPRQGRLAAAVAADQKNQFAAAQGEVDRADAETAVAFGMPVGKGHIA